MGYTRIELQKYPAKFAEIAQKYLKEHGSCDSWGLFSNHRSQEYAESLKELQARKSSDVEKWVSMCEIYIRMNNPGGSLAKAMEVIVTNHFKNETITSLYKKLLFELGGVPEIYTAIGKYYLNKHPEKDSGLFGYGSHTHQEHARAIKAAEKDNQGAAFWLYLYHKYQSIQRSGDLASAIVNVFETHFKAKMGDIIETLELDSFAKDLTEAKKIQISLEDAAQQRFKMKVLEGLSQLDKPYLEVPKGTVAQPTQ